jgi:hypothetical protein
MNGIIDCINERIGKGLDRLPNPVHFIPFGLAKPIEIREEGFQSSMPAVVDNSGECHYVFTDDRFSIGWYHRLVLRNYSKGKGVGDYDTDIETDEILLVCWGLSDKLNMQAEEVESRIIIPAIPERADLVSSNFDAKQVLTGEFRNISYLNRPEEFIFSVKYKISLAFNRKCREKK